MKLTLRQKDIINIITAQQQAPISKIKKQLQDEVSTPTLNRELATLVANNHLLKTGKGRATSYSISPYYKIFAPLVIADYFDKGPDARKAATKFNHNLLAVLEEIDLLTPVEKEHLGGLRQKYQANISNFRNFSITQCRWHCCPVNSLSLLGRGLG
ncbi:MAG: hypothetical protein ABW166_10205 [Sedimenticola sp.]